MKIAVVGCGAVGSYYGGKLAHSGQEVHFLLRSDYEVVRRKGVFIRSPKGDFEVRPKCARVPEEIGPSDLVLIALKTTANNRFAELLPALAGPNTILLTLQNGLGNEEDLAGLFDGRQIMGGLCFVCLNRLSPGLIHHMDHGKVVLGEFSGWPEPRTHDVASMFQHAGVPCAVAANLAQAHWEKLVWNIPFNGLGVAAVAGYDAVAGGRRPIDATPVASCLSTDKLLSDPRWELIVRELMLEVIAAAQAQGFKISTELAAHQIEGTRSMGAYKASTLIDFERGLALEMKSLFLEPLRKAQAAGVPVPRLERLFRILSALDPGRGNASSTLPGKD